MALIPITREELWKKKGLAKYYETAEKSIIPSQNGCCTKVCEILNKKIDENLETVFECQELYGTSTEPTKYCSATAKRKAATLRDLRYDLVIQGSCKCAEFETLMPKKKEEL